jgi:hypothetical protein
MNRNRANEIMKEVGDLLKNYAESNKLAFSGVRASFGVSNIKVSVELAEISKGGEVLSREAIELKNYADVYGLPQKAYGMTFRDRGQTFKLVGLAPRRSKMPVIVENDSGKKYKMSLEYVKAMLGVKE